MKESMLILVLAFACGFGAAWSIQGNRWAADVALIRLEAAEAQDKAQKALDARMAEAEDQKEKIQNEFEAFKAAERARDTGIESGAKRVYVRANCPTVPSTSTDTSRAESRPAELDPAYRSALSALRRGAEEQLRLLNICRAELMAR